jgi:hypothetical protein
MPSVTLSEVRSTGCRRLAAVTLRHPSRQLGELPTRRFLPPGRDDGD